MLTEATVAANVPVEDPDATVMLPGIVTALELLARATLWPADGAAELRVTVQDVLPAPVNELVPHESALTDGAMPEPEPVRFNVIVFETLPCEAVSVTLCEAVTAAMDAEKLALLAPEATVTEAGTVTAPLLLARLTTRPVPGAAPVNLMVQLSVEDPKTEEFAQLKEDSVAVPEFDPLPCSFTVLDMVVVVCLLKAETLICPFKSVSDPGSNLTCATRV